MRFTLSQAAREAGVSKSTMSKAVADGRVSAERLHDGSFQIEAAELFRVFPRKTAERGAEPFANPNRASENGSERPAVEVAVLRVQLQLMGDQLERERQERERDRKDRDREREDRERERETHRETLADLRKRLDQEQEERRGLQRLLAAPAAAPAQEPEPEPAPAPELAQEPPSESPALMPILPDRTVRGLLARLLGR